MNLLIRKSIYASFILLIAPQLLAQVNFSGFFDVQYKYSQNNIENKNVELGQFELGIQKQIRNDLNVEGAIAFNSETQNFELGSAYADFLLLNNETGSSNNILGDLGIKVGQFDVPFGIDYHCIASPDRKMITAPISVQNSIGCFNSLGLEVYGNSENYNFNVYLINGFVDVLGFGGRVGFLPFHDLEIGYSYLSDFGSSQNITPQAMGADIKYISNKFELKGEFVSSKGLYQGEIETLSSKIRNNGYYLQISHFFDGPLELPFSAAVRYGNWAGQNNGSLYHKINRLTMLLGITIMENAEVRAEYSVNKVSTSNLDNLFNLQLVLTF